MTQLLLLLSIGHSFGCKCNNYYWNNRNALMIFNEDGDVLHGARTKKGQ